MLITLSRSGWPRISRTSPAQRCIIANISGAVRASVSARSVSRTGGDTPSRIIASSSAAARSTITQRNRGVNASSASASAGTSINRENSVGPVHPPSAWCTTTGRIGGSRRAAGRASRWRTHTRFM
jgi:hypothetical protein